MPQQQNGINYVPVGFQNEYRNSNTGMNVYTFDYKDNPRSNTIKQWDAPLEAVAKWKPTPERLQKWKTWNSKYKNDSDEIPIANNLNAMKPEDVHVWIESEWEGDSSANSLIPFDSYSETHYIIELTKTRVKISDALNSNQLSAKTKTWIKKIPKTPNRRVYTNSYFDMCVNITKNVGPINCHNLTGEYIHALVERKVYDEMRILPATVEYINYSEPSKWDYDWAYQHLSDLWSLHNVKRELAEKRKVISRLVDSKTRIKQVYNIIKAIFDMYIDQTSNTELPFTPEMIERRIETFNTMPDLQGYNTDAHRQQIGIYMTTNPNANVIKKGAPFRAFTGNYVADVVDADVDNNERRKRVSLRPDILFGLEKLAPEFKSNTPIDLGTTSTEYQQNNRNFKSLQTYTFPAHGRMCAIEIKSSRGYPKRPENTQWTNKYIKTIINNNMNSVTKDYRKWHFNGTVFIINIFYDFDRIVVSQVEINQFIARNGPMRYNLKHYYTNN